MFGLLSGRALGHALGRAFFAATLALAPLHVSAEEALAAIAANFAGAAESLAAQFTLETGHEVVLTTGSTGKLYAQIAAGAPFDMMLSADAGTPARLIDEGLGVEGSSFAYASGRLALWSADPGRIGDDGQEALRASGLRHLAIANPELAPYGKAARDALDGMGLWEAVQPKIVMGQNIGQTHAMVASGAAELGLIAFSAVQQPGLPAEGSYWEVPQQFYAPIRQDAVLLAAGRDNAAARAFLDYLRSDAAAQIIAAYGYGAGDGGS
ncbi:MAG: molybdate ABC transporter substrate-binding protein [Roseovarius sp. BRH_c41]|jgi:molybdate transport system substrate-binding protein|uniref:molybdate ABC transporter substrate-binding protein n=1 Tax=Roseovarius sp. BRH_c41 TaxID=1629709 RepID=UPI0005F264CF|nr:molybdate ABC transporter substrate-binding protein [Roseovarius sp. BRH_c41]KJS42856.1 MAG: molybdate ABC transporter substrate-binding protein [Roseovarius sp. BRH_c41]